MKEVKKNTEKPDNLKSFPDSLPRDYEDLRSYTLGNITGFSHPLGLDLFLKKGFLSWIKVHTESMAYRKPLHEPEQVIKKSVFLVQDLQQEITLLLANMILEGRANSVSA